MRNNIARANKNRTYAIVRWTLLVRDTEYIVTTFTVTQSVTAPYNKNVPVA